MFEIKKEKDMSSPAHTGSHGKNSKAVVAGLKTVLADTFVLYYKTHGFHWNIESSNFIALHEFLEEQYTELWKATDEIAERMRILNAYAPSSLAELVKSAKLHETTQTPDSAEMLRQLAEDNASIVSGSLYPALHLAEEAGDEATVDLMVERIRTHEKAAWMLRSHLN